MNMRVLVSLGLGLSILATSLLAAGLDDIKNKGVLSVSLYKDFPRILMWLTVSKWVSMWILPML